MNHDSITPLTPDEALHAFMDGELDLSYEQRLFDELAGDPLLRQEMKDALVIREAVRKDLVAAPSSGEAALLAALGGTTGATAVTTGASVTAAGGTTFLAGLSYTVGGMVAGFLIAFLFFQPGDVTNDVQADRTGIDFGRSTAVVDRSGRPGDAEQALPVRVDTVFAVRYVEPAPRPVQREEIVAQTPSPVSTPTATESRELPVTSSAMAQTFARPTFDGQHSLALNQPLSPGTYAPQVRFRIRTLASGLQSGESTPVSVSESIMPNTAFSITYPVGDRHYVGLEMGQESFKQQFNGILNGREIQYTQVPVLLWFGATYEYQGDELPFLAGLSPFVNSTLGFAVQQGPLARATLGLAYQPVGPLRFTLGLDASALAYQFESNWYAAPKFGLSYGLSIDLGAIR
jgi:hypothetical protein